MITEFKNEYRFLSNFYPCEIEFDGLIYNSVEHAYVAAKTTDLELRAQIHAIDKPGDVKKFGRTLELRKDWDSIKIGVMEELVAKKFLHADLAYMLKKTGNEFLIEGNWWGDTFWGESPIGIGTNHLGHILMEIRDNL